MNFEDMINETADLIVEAVKFSTIIGVNSADCGTSLSASLFLNIRDAMFHFKALCEYSEKKDKYGALKHYYNLKEHLLRGEKDAAIVQAHAVSAAIFEVMQQKDFEDIFSIEDIRKMQSYNHRIKEVILKLRLEGSDLVKNNDFSIEDAWGEIAFYTENVEKICKEKNISLF